MAGIRDPLGELLARAVLDNLYRFIVPAVAGRNGSYPSLRWPTGT